MPELREMTEDEVDEAYDAATSVICILTADGNIIGSDVDVNEGEARFIAESLRALADTLDGIARLH